MLHQGGLLINRYMYNTLKSSLINNFSPWITLLSLETSTTTVRISLIGGPIKALHSPKKREKFWTSSVKISIMMYSAPSTQSGKCIHGREMWQRTTRHALKPQLTHT